MLKDRSIVVLEAGFGPEDTDETMICCGTGFSALR